MPLVETTIAILFVAGWNMLVLRQGKLIVAPERAPGSLTIHHSQEMRLGTLGYWLIWIGLPANILLIAGIPRGDDAFIILILMGLAVCFNAYLTWETFGLAYHLGEDGITERRPWMADRQLYWRELQDVGLRRGNLVLRCQSDHVTINLAKRDMLVVTRFIQSQLHPDRRNDVGTRELLAKVG